MKFMFSLKHPLTCKLWVTLFKPCNKVRGKYNCRVLPASFLHASFCVRLSLLLLSRYDTANEYTTIFLFFFFFFVFFTRRCNMACESFPVSKDNICPVFIVNVTELFECSDIFHIMQWENAAEIYQNRFFSISSLTDRPVILTCSACDLASSESNILLSSTEWNLKKLNKLKALH